MASPFEFLLLLGRRSLASQSTRARQQKSVAPIRQISVFSVTSSCAHDNFTMEQCQRSYGHCLRYGTVKKEQKDAVMSFCNDVFVALPTGYGKLFNGIKQELHHSYSQISKFSFVFLFHSINTTIVYFSSIYTTLLHVNHVGGVASLAS